MEQGELLENRLINYTVANSNYEEHRSYIGLSKISEPAEKLAQLYKSNQSADVKTKLKCYKGYQMEADIIDRLKKIYLNRINIEKTITAYDGLVQGHPDGWLDDFPLDVKSVLCDDWIPETKLPTRIYWQMQGYLLYARKEKAFVIFESRENGIIRVKTITPNYSIQKAIDEKLRKTIQLIKSGNAHA